MSYLDDFADLDNGDSFSHILANLIVVLIILKGEFGRLEKEPLLVKIYSQEPIGKYFRSTKFRHENEQSIYLVGEMPCPQSSSLMIEVYSSDHRRTLPLQALITKSKEISFTRRIIILKTRYNKQRKVLKQ